MVLIKYFLFYFSIEFSKHLINCDPDSANEQAISNDLVFDLRNLKTEDYHIFELIKNAVSYEFIPKDPKIITEVIINDRLVWKRSDEEKIVEIVVFVAYKLPHTYELNIIDKNKNAHSIHFHYFDTLRSIGMIEFLNLNYDSLIFDYNQYPVIFDLKNPFDYVYHITKKFESPDFKLKIVDVFPRKDDFIDIYENVTKITDLDNSIKNFELSTNDKKFVLLRLTLDTFPTYYVYYKFHENKWSLIDEDEYVDIFEDSNLESASLLNDEDKPIGREWSISVNESRNFTESVNIRNEKLMLIPTNIYKFEFLESLFESDNQIFSSYHYYGVIYVFRDPLGIKMIEVVHSSKEDQTRKPNSYYIKEGDDWKETRQGLFIQKLMEQTVSILKEKGAPPELLETIENLHIIKNRDSVYKSNLDLKSTFILPEIKIMPPKEGTQDNRDKPINPDLNDQPQDNKENKDIKENKDKPINPDLPDQPQDNKEKGDIKENKDKPINPDLNDQPQDNKENKDIKENKDKPINPDLNDQPQDNKEKDLKGIKNPDNEDEKIDLKGSSTMIDINGQLVIPKEECIYSRVDKRIDKKKKLGKDEKESSNFPNNEEESNFDVIKPIFGFFGIFVYLLVVDQFN